jgi:hypothetical protein
VEIWEAPIGPSARKHGISDESIRHALWNFIGRIDDPEDDDVELVLGPDYASNLIEVEVLQTEDGFVIIHAMAGRMRRFFPHRRR